MTEVRRLIDRVANGDLIALERCSELVIRGRISTADRREINTSINAFISQWRRAHRKFCDAYTRTAERLIKTRRGKWHLAHHGEWVSRCEQLYRAKNNVSDLIEGVEPSWEEDVCTRCIESMGEYSRRAFIRNEPRWGQEHGHCVFLGRGYGYDIYVSYAEEDPDKHSLLDADDYPYLVFRHTRYRHMIGVGYAGRYYNHMPSPRSVWAWGLKLLKDSELPLDAPPEVTRSQVSA